MSRSVAGLGAADNLFRELGGPDPHILSELGALGLIQIIGVGVVAVAVALSGQSFGLATGLNAPYPALSVFFLAFCGMVVLVAAHTAIVWLLAPENVLADLKPFVASARSHWWWLLLLVVGFGAPLMEEVLFRGVLLQGLANSRLGFAGAAILSSGVWTALHFGYTVAGLSQVFLIGLYLCWLMWRHASLWLVLFCHGVYNSLLVVLMMVVPIPSS